jgi:hypothetical protein
MDAAEHTDAGRDEAVTALPNDKPGIDTDRLKLRHDPESKAPVLEVHHGRRGKKILKLPLTDILGVDSAESFGRSGVGTVTLYIDPTALTRRPVKLKVHKVPNVRHVQERIDYEAKKARTSTVRGDTVETTMKSHEETLLTAPDRARERAQRGFAIAGAIAAALAGLGAIADLSKRKPPRASNRYCSPSLLGRSSIGLPRRGDVRTTGQIRELD